MKRILIVAALILAALTMRAQQPTDSVSVMLRHLANTNMEIERLNRAYTSHAAMVGIGGAAMLLGGLVTHKGAKDVTNGVSADTQLVKAGMWIAGVGAAFIAASFIPMPKRVTLDSRGLVVDIDKGKRRK